MGRLTRAWEKVAAEDGAPGPDGVGCAEWAWDWEDRLYDLHHALRKDAYRPGALREAKIPRPDGGTRTIHIATTTDRVAMRAVHDALSGAVDDRFSDSAFGYRPGRGVADAVGEVVRLRSRGLLWVVDADIEDFFASIPHRPLLEAAWEWTSDRRLVRFVGRWLARCGTEADPDRGLALGLPISPILSNVYLHTLDVRMRESGWPIVRYADDFCVFDRREPGARQARSAVEGVLSGLGLRLNDEKTAVRHFQDGFLFLGVMFDRRGQRIRAGTQWLPVEPDDDLWRDYLPPGYG